MDHAFGFQTVDLRSNPTRFLLFLFICSLYFLFYLLIYFTIRYFLIKHGILFTNFVRVEFECMFHLFLCCSVFNFDFFLEPKKYVTLVPSYKLCENNDNMSHDMTKPTQ